MDFLKVLGIEKNNRGTSTGQEWLGDSENSSLISYTPIDNSAIAGVAVTTRGEFEQVIQKAQGAFKIWRATPAPKRGEIVRQIGLELREHKDDLGKLVSYEMGKIFQEGAGEVQEMIDICDFAVGQSRQLYGSTMQSERGQHRMYDQWHPLGPAGVITAFNFPVAVFAWNAMIAAICGDVVIWKPSEKTPLTALACQSLLARAADGFGHAPANLSQVLIGDASVASQLVEDPRMKVISATGSCAMGRIVAPKVAARLGRSILELGGNNAITVGPSADIAMATAAIVFGAVGTAGQRCTSTRRLFVHDSVYAELVSKLKAIYARVTVGNPLEGDNLVGPLIDKRAFDAMQANLNEMRDKGATITGGERVDTGDSDAWYVRPALVEMPETIPNVKEETFAPILYVFRYTELTDAIRRNNDVPQGLSSSIFTLDMREAELFTSAAGSDCGIVNVNIGTSGAEIGGAFGGEKDTGGGRESGSDAWKGYMRRSTSTINYGTELPLAQGIRFDV